MKFLKVLSLSFFILVSLFTISAHENKLKLTLVTENKHVPQGKDKFFSLFITNISDQPVDLLDANRIDPFWGGFNFFWFTDDGKKVTEKRNMLHLPVRKPKKEGIIVLNPGDSIRVGGGSFPVNDLSLHKVYARYTQDPKTVHEDYKKALKKDYDRLSFFQLNSDTLFYDNQIRIKEIFDYISYKDLSFEEKKGSTTFVKYSEHNLSNFTWYSTDVTTLTKLHINLSEEKDRSNLEYLPLLKNVKWLSIKMDIADTIPDLTQYFTNIVYLKLQVKGNSSLKKEIQGLEQFKKLNTLEYLDLSYTFLPGSQEWIYNNKKLEVLILNNAMQEFSPAITSLDNLRILKTDYSRSYSPKIDFSFEGLKKLEELDIRNTKINYSDDFIQKTSELRKIYIEIDSVNALPNLKSNSIEDVEIKINSKTIPFYPTGINEMSNVKRIVLDGNFGDIEAPDFNTCVSLNFFVIRDKTMTTVPASIYKIRERGVEKTFVHGKNLIVPFNK